MPTNCVVCEHDQRALIDGLLVSGSSVRDIAGRFAGISKSAVARHRSHVERAMAQAQQARQVQEIEHGGSLLDQLDAIKAEARQIFEESRSSPNIALTALARMLDCVNIMAKIQGKISDGTTIQLSVSPEWAAARSIILQALMPFPEARTAVATALQTLSLPNARD